MRSIILILSLLLLQLSGAAAQSDTARPDDPTVDSAASHPFTMTRSPTVAVFLSIIPGGGQIYTEQYWKVPLFVGAAGYFVARIIALDAKFREYAAQYEALAANDPQRATLKSIRESYRDDRDRNGAYLLGVEVLGMVDAYVDAHLFDFDVGDERLGLQIYPLPDRIGAGLTLTVR